MQLTSLAAACLLAVCAAYMVSTIKATVADRMLRRYWYTCAATVAGVASLLVYFSFSGNFPGTFNQDYLILVLGMVLSATTVLATKTFAYFKEISTINGIEIYDPVSGVFNRVYLEQRLDTEVARCHRYGSPLGIVTVEVKDFIQLNDEFGYQGSAIATSKVANRLKALLRETDIVANFSAGRFVLVLPDTPEGSLAGLVNRLRGAIDGMVVIDGAGLENSVAINVIFGVSHCELKTRNAQELIAAAFSSTNQESPYDFLTESATVEKLLENSL